MKPIIVILIIFACVVHADVPSDPVESAAWKERVMRNAARDFSKPRNEAIPLLAERIYALEQPWNRSHDSEEVLRECQRLIVSIPGHAKYFKDQIEKKRAEAARYEAMSDEERERLGRAAANGISKDLPNESEFRSYQRDALERLGYISSPESVAVLGYYLSEPEGLRYIEHPSPDVNNPPAEVAVWAIGWLGIENAPQNKSKRVTMEYLNAWKQWWSEIESGKRTYRFKDSPIEYGPDGPASKETLDRIARDRRRDDGPKRGIATEAESDGKSAASRTPWLALSASVTALLAACWYLLRGRKKAAS